MQIEVILASRNSFYREGMVAILQRIFCECRVLQAPTVKHLKDQLISSNLNLILIDRKISINKSWKDILIDMYQTRPDIPVCLMADAMSSKAQIRAAFELGVKGYLHSDSSTEEIERTINEAISGRVSFPESIWGQEKKRGGYKLLTARQLEIMSYIEQGKSNKAIADILNLSVATVKRHISNIFKVLSAKNRVEAINTLERFDQLH